MAGKQIHVELTVSSESPDVLVVALSGELDNASIDTMQKNFEVLSTRTEPQVVIELSEVTFLSSAALGELIGARRRIVDRAGELVLAGMDIRLRTTLNSLGANKIFQFFNDIRSALNYFQWKNSQRTEQLVMSFPSNLKFVPPVRHLISRTVRQKGYSNRDSFRIETIVDEICNNAVQYGSNPKHQNINLRIAVSNEKIEIDAENVSDPAKVALLKDHLSTLEDQLNMDRESKRGRGLALVKMLASELSAECSGSGTTVHVTKLKKEE